MVSNKELEAVSKLSSVKRFEYFIKRIADFEEVWVLHNEEIGYALNVENDDSKYFPVWPFKEFSEKWISGEFSQFLSVKLNLYEFKDNILPKLEINGINILVFPTADAKGYIIEVKEFAKIIDDELSQYE